MMIKKVDDRHQVGRYPVFAVLVLAVFVANRPGFKIGLANDGIFVALLGVSCGKIHECFLLVVQGSGFQKFLQHGRRLAKRNPAAGFAVVRNFSGQVVKVNHGISQHFLCRG